jgi:hypothetical protein
MVTTFALRFVADNALPYSGTNRTRTQSAVSQD